ncbi:MAG TPA: response regulator [Verrucomicrobiae bacterium]
MQQKILLLDDEQDFLDLYQEMLSKHLSTLPDVQTASSGSRGLSLLEGEPFNLLIVDLQMPKMDGLQVLSIARRKYPQLRLVVLTAIRDEQFRTRAYAMGVDQYWIKPETDQEMGLFMESIESLLSREAQGGFRGVQSKSLVDIIQLECLSQSSVMLKINNGLVEGRIWVQNGEVIDAESGEMSAEPAFQRILAWKTGSFEIFPGDATRTRTIFTSYQGLLLNTAQALDEAASQRIPEAEGEESGHNQQDAPTFLAEISQLDGVEFVLTQEGGRNKKSEFWGLDDPDRMTAWTRNTLETFDELGERLQVGQLQQVIGTGPKRKVALALQSGANLCVGFSGESSAEQVRDTMKTILNKWAS